MSKPRIGLALGSGSARGWAHIGVIRELAEIGVVPDLVCGASIGAFVGAAYANGDLEKLDGWAHALTWKAVLGFFDLGFNGGLIKGEKLVDFFERHFVDRDFKDLPLPFACVATDLASGREIWLRDGSVAQAVRASIALPGLFTPLHRDGAYLVDGGLVNPVPVSLCRALGADCVIAVDLGSDVGARRLKASIAPRPRWHHRVGRMLGVQARPVAADGAPQPSVLDVIANSINIMQVRIARSRLAGEPADVLIAPRLAHLGLLDYHRAEEAIKEGRAEVRRQQALIERALEEM